VGDVDGSRRFLLSQVNANGKVGVIGYCSGGRQTYLSACRLPFDAAVDCYGAFVVGSSPEGFPVKMEAVVGLTGDLSCPLLGLFGADDQAPSPAHVAEIEAALKEHGKTYEFHSYEGAGHGFFATDRTMYRPEAATDGWQRIWTWFDRYLAS
jgi:carboxymethylenebutenolidase